MCLWCLLAKGNSALSVELYFPSLDRDQSRKANDMRRYVLIGLCALCIWLMASEGLARGLNARTEGLAGAGVGVIGSGQAIQYNPAGLAFMEGREAYFTFLDRVYGREYIAGLVGNTGIGTFGLSAINYDYGSGEIWISSNPVRTDDLNDYTISGGCGVMMTDRLAVGASLHLFHSGLYKTNELDFDLGTYFLTGFNTIVSAGVENVSTGIGDSGPVRLHTGLFLDMMSLLDLKLLSHFMDLVLDVNDYVNDDRDRGPWMNLGMEYQYRYLLSGYVLEFALRGGLPAIYGGGSIDTTWGVGVKFETEGGRGIRVDYAPSRYNQHIVSLAFVF